MAFTAADLDTIDAALVQVATDGIVTVSVGGQSVTARSVDELLKIRDTITRVLAETSATSTYGLRFSKTIPPGAG